jgi:DNA-binding NarL/FixJ family response regulator
MQVLRVQRGDCWGHILPQNTRTKMPTPTTPPQTVARIKTLLAQGKKGTTIAALLNVTETTVSRIKRGKTYK